MRGKLRKEIYFPSLYVEKNDKVLKRLLDLQKLKVSLTRREMINFSNLELQDNQVWDFLDNLILRGRSRGKLRFKRETTPEIAQLLGFIITDGSLLSTEGRVKLCQMDIDLIKKYIDIINEEYQTNVPYTYDGKEANVGSVPLRFILHKYYKIPLCKKVFTVETPVQILSSENKEILRSYIAGLFDGDGYIQCYYLKDSGILDHLHFCISTSSHVLVKQAISILDKLGVKCNSNVRKDDNRMTLSTSGFSNSLLSIQGEVGKQKHNSF